MSQACPCGQEHNGCGCANRPTSTSAPTPEFRVGDEFEIRVKVVQPISDLGQGYAGCAVLGAENWTISHSVLRKARRVERPLAVGDQVRALTGDIVKILALAGSDAWVEVRGIRFTCGIASLQRA